MSTTRSKFAPIAICLAFGLAACGDDAKSTDDVTTPTENEGGYDYGTDTTVAEAAATTVAQAPDTTGGVPASGAFTVMIGTTGLGHILVDGDGNTLYVFMSDPVDTVTCTGGCASAWPGFLSDGSPVNADFGIDPSLITTVTGDGGAAQWAINGHPLYYFSGDSAPGDTNGQGSGGVWYVVDIDGNPVT